MKKILQHLCVAMSVFATSTALSLQIFRTGSAYDTVTHTSSSICLAGGGSDDGWAGGWKYLLEQSGGGDVVIIRADQSRGGYENWIYNDEGNHQFPKVNSVTTISIDSAKDANRPEVVNALLHAEFIFFAGGDQSDYIGFFRNSNMARAVNYMIHTKRIPVAGTSAGMALLAGIDYSGKYPSPTDPDSNVTSEDVLKNPTAEFVDLDRTVFVAPFLDQVITETHFSAREREGRLVGFMAKAVFNNYHGIGVKEIKGIAADEETAVCYGHSGIAKVFGRGNVYFLRGNRPIERLQMGRSLDWDGQGEAINVYFISGNDSQARFDLKAWVGFGGRAEFWSVDGAIEAAPNLRRSIIRAF